VLQLKRGGDDEDLESSSEEEEVRAAQRSRLHVQSTEAPIILFQNYQRVQPCYPRGELTSPLPPAPSQDDGVIPDKTEAQIFETLVKIRNKDPAVYDKDAKFYSDDEEEAGGEGAGAGEGADGAAEAKPSNKRERPMFLKDVVYQQAMQAAERGDAGASSSEDEDDGGDGGAGARVKTYTEEQRELKSAFLQAFDKDAEGDDAVAGVAGEGEGEGPAFGGVLQPRARKGGGGGEGGGGEGRVQELLDDYFGGGGRELPEEDQFLRNYILNKGWVDADGGDDDSDDGAGDGGGGGGGGGGVSDGEDEAALLAADAFEAQYNFRYEEPGGAQIATYPRQVEGTVRKEDDRRKRQREAKAARAAAAEEARAADLRRLKNLKKREIETRLGEVQAVAGAAAPSQHLLDALLEGDFDPEAHDRAMAAAFGDAYYGAEGEGDEDEELADAEFEAQLAAMAEYGTDDEGAAAGTFRAVHARVTAAAAGGEEGEGGEAEEEEEEEGGEDEEEAGGAAAAAARAEVSRLLEEYHRLDYEDHVGGVPTRFRYKEVAPDAFGLTPEEILTMDDKELNQVVGLKRVAAPYRTDGGRLRPNYGKLNEMRRARQEEGGYGGGRGGGRGGGGWRPARDGGPTHYSAGRGAGAAGAQPRPHAQAGGGEAPAGAERPPQRTEAEKRLASYAKPTLKRDRPSGGAGGGGAGPAGGGGKRRKQEGGGGQQQRQPQQPPDGPQLSKAQKKNMKRGAKRAGKPAPPAAQA
jgi:protein KRI1